MADEAKPSESPSSDTGSEVLEQDEIQALLDQQEEPGQPTDVATPSPPADESLPAADAEFLLRQAEEALASVDAPREGSTDGPAEFRLESFGGAPASADSATLELIRDVELDVRIELGRTHLQLEDVLKLRRGSVVALDKLAGDPVDIFVNGRMVARGEVLVLNESFCVRVNELVAAQAVRTA